LVTEKQTDRRRQTTEIMRWQTDRKGCRR